MIDAELAQDIERYLLEQIPVVLGTDFQVTRATSLNEVPLDSLDLVELVALVEERFGLERSFKEGPLTDVTGRSTVGDLIDSLAWEREAEPAVAARRRPGLEAREAVDTLRTARRLSWRGRKPALPTPVRLRGPGKSAVEYVSRGRR